MCSQAVFAAFSEKLGISEKQALQIGACFGGGMNKAEVCGACTGALMVIGMKYGQYDENDLESCTNGNAKAVQFLDEFAKRKDNPSKYARTSNVVNNETGVKAFFDKLGFTTIDERPNGGYLWILDGSKDDTKAYIDTARRVFRISSIQFGTRRDGQKGWYTKTNK